MTQPGANSALALKRGRRIGAPRCAGRSRGILSEGRSPRAGAGARCANLRPGGDLPQGSCELNETLLRIEPLSTPVARPGATLCVLVLLLAAFHVDTHAQGAATGVQGIVTDTSGTPLENVEVAIGQRRARTDARGSFRLDSIPAGPYLISLRLVGYRPVRAQLTVLATGVTRVSFELAPAVPQLPTVVVEASRTGIYGAVHDPAYTPIGDAHVEVVGRGGGTVATDSAGRFAFPTAERGLYLVRVTHAGYRERVLTVELERGKGQEFLIRLTPGKTVESRMTRVAMQELERRLVWGFRRDFLAAQDLQRYRRLGLCDIPQVKAELGRSSDALTTLILNGVTIYKSFPVTALCLWSADEVELVEVGRDFCRDVTNSLAYLLGGGGCGGRISRGARRSGGGYIVIWERR